MASIQSRKGGSPESGIDLSVLTGHVVEEATFFNVRNNPGFSSVFKAIRLKLDDWPIVEARMEKHGFAGGQEDWEWKYDCPFYDMGCIAPPRVSLATINLLQVEEA